MPFLASSLARFEDAPLGISAPTGRCYVSPEQRPGLAVDRDFQALKGRHSSCEQHRAAPSGLEIL